MHNNSAIVRHLVVLINVLVHYDYGGASTTVKECLVKVNLLLAAHRAPGLDRGGGGGHQQQVFTDAIVIVGSAPLWRSPPRGWLTRDIALAYLTRSRGRFITGAAKPAQSLRRRPRSRYNNIDIILPRSDAL